MRDRAQRIVGGPGVPRRAARRQGQADRHGGEPGPCKMAPKSPPGHRAATKRPPAGKRHPKDALEPRP
eukprot:7790626-Pyramimonas_sp.AAC.1